MNGPSTRPWIFHFIAIRVFVMNGLKVVQLVAKKVQRQRDTTTFRGPRCVIQSSFEAECKNKQRRIKDLKRFANTFSIVLAVEIP